MKINIRKWRPLMDEAFTQELREQREALIEEARSVLGVIDLPLEHFSTSQERTLLTEFRNCVYGEITEGPLKGCSYKMSIYARITRMNGKNQIITQVFTHVR